MHRSLAFILAALLAAPVFAQEPSANEMIARGHYTRGAEAYDERRYEDALHEFVAAHAARPLPAFDYDIARCNDRLERKPEALAAYERFMSFAPAVDERSAMARDRITQLRHEIAEQLPPNITPTIDLTTPIVPPPSHRQWIVPGIAGGITLAFAAVGAGLLGSSETRYHGLASGCSPACAPSSWATLPAQSHAGEALLGIAAAGAVVDVVLLVRAARRK